MSFLFWNGSTILFKLLGLDEKWGGEYPFDFYISGTDSCNGDSGGIQIGRVIDRQKDRHTYRQKDRNLDRKKERKACRSEAGRQDVKKTDRQIDRQIDS